MKKAFTMVELIFVIVVIGVLAGLALPKMFATRDDAELAKSLANFHTLLDDISKYYITNGTYGSFAQMSKVPLVHNTSVTGGDYNAGTGRFSGIFKVGGKTCVYVDVRSERKNTDHPGCDADAGENIIIWANEAARGTYGKLCQKFVQSEQFRSNLELISEAKTSGPDTRSQADKDKCAGESWGSKITWGNSDVYMFRVDNGSSEESDWD